MIRLVFLRVIEVLYKSRMEGISYIFHTHCEGYCVCHAASNADYYWRLMKSVRKRYTYCIVRLFYSYVYSDTFIDSFLSYVECDLHEITFISIFSMLFLMWTFAINRSIILTIERSIENIIWNNTGPILSKEHTHFCISNENLIHQFSNIYFQKKQDPRLNLFL